MKKKATVEAIQRDILLKSLPHIPFDGWTRALFDRAEQESQYSKELVDAAFPNQVRDLVICFARYMDEQMLVQLQLVDTGDMRVRDKITLGVQTRLNILENYREAERLAVGFWAMPSQSRHGLKSLWQTSDAIWNFAGDTATDYNRYTKRGLLSGVISKVTFYWLSDTSPDYQETSIFLDRQINAVLSMGKTMAHAKGTLNYIWDKVSFIAK